MKPVSPIRLPEPSQEGGPPVWSVLAERRSIRSYASDPMPQGVLSQLLWSTHGTTANSAGRRLRNAPSAGACYPIDVYVVANNVTRLNPGLYRYLVGDHKLLLIREGDVGTEVARAALGQSMCASASVTFIWTAVPNRTTARYGDRGLRYIYMDAGHVGQNTYLAATALLYGCCTIGAFDDDAMNKILGVDGQRETSVYAASVGPMPR